MVGPLNDVRVIDLTHALAGPVASQMLADLGADVIKIETVEHGDLFRAIDDVVPGASSYFLALNRNKRSMTLNLKHAAGKDIFFALAKTADVCLENFTPGVVDRLGIGYPSVRAVARSIIYCHVSGYGQSGPYRDRPAFDQIMQGEAGLLSMSGTNETPARVAIPITDILAGKDAAFAILSALHHRDRTGEGQEIDVSMFASSVASLYQFLYRFWYKQELPNKSETRHPFMVPYGVYKTQDGFVNVAALGDRQWRSLCTAIGRPDLYADDRFAGMESRVNHRAELDEILETLFASRTTAEWLNELIRQGVPCGRVNDLNDVLMHPQLEHAGLVHEIHDTERGMDLKLMGFPVQMSQTPATIRNTAPLLGAHTNDILSDLGFTEQDILRLHEDGVV